MIEVLEALAPGGLDRIEAVSRRAGERADPAMAWRRPGQGRRIDPAAFARVLVQAAIAAGKAGGAAAPAGHLEAMPAETAAWLRAELDRPPMLDHLTRGLECREDMICVYAISAMVLDAGGELAQHYLKMLAARLGLEQALTAQIGRG